MDEDDEHSEGCVSVCRIPFIPETVAWELLYKQLIIKVNEMFTQGMVIPSTASGADSPYTTNHVHFEWVTL